MHTYQYTSILCSYKADINLNEEDKSEYPHNHID